MQKYLSTSYCFRYLLKTLFPHLFEFHPMIKLSCLSNELTYSEEETMGGGADLPDLYENPHAPLPEVVTTGLSDPYSRPESLVRPPSAATSPHGFLQFFRAWRG